MNVIPVSLLILFVAYAVLVYISPKQQGWLAARLLARRAYIESGKVAYNNELMVRLAEFSPLQDGLEISRGPFAEDAR